MAAAPGFEHSRYELKCRLTREREELVRDAVRAFAVPDPQAKEGSGGRYTVRSIYFDTEDLRFYHEKMAGLKTRRKLRIRTYDSSFEQARAFLEIKRRTGRTIFKERAQLPMSLVPLALLESEESETALEHTGTDRVVLDRFRYNLQVLNLKPVVLVTYDREAFVGPDDSGGRVTMDLGLRSLATPQLSQIFAEDELRAFDPSFFILELKFDQDMPVWIQDLVRRLHLRPEAYSKYCHGVDAWERRGA
jgi:SPX domain protein involved in polyphosphate accumulation